MNKPEPVAWIEAAELLYLELVSGNKAWGGFLRKIEVAGNREGWEPLYPADALAALQEENERLKAERDDAADDARFAERIAAKREHDAEARAQAAEQRLEEAVKALEPFVPVWDEWMDKRGDGEKSNMYRSCTFGQIRAARSFISSVKGKDNG